MLLIDKAWTGSRRIRMGALEAGIATGVVLARSALRVATWGLVGGATAEPAVPVSEPRGQRWSVTADDGTALHAEIDGDPGAPVTAVLCHGYALNSASWCFQRAELARQARVVAWDQRGHGRSQRGPSAHATIDQLGRDLLAVLDQTGTTGPVVLIGHSMGGMAILALAGQHPELFGSRIVGVALLGTSAGPVTGDFGMSARVMDAVHWAAPWAFSALRRMSRAAPVREVVQLLVPRHAFASPVPAAVADFLVDLIDSTPLPVLADFFPQFRYHDKRDALPSLHEVECLVMAGDHDTVIPCGDTEEICRTLPEAEFVVLPNAGHAFPLEHPDLVNAHLSRLLRVFASRRTA
jgi:pimeloyl-ACP methyl ester carboxylesterase